MAEASFESYLEGLEGLEGHKFVKVTKVKKSPNHEVKLRKSRGCKGNQDFLGKVYFFKTKLVVSGMVVSEPSRPLKN